MDTRNAIWLALLNSARWERYYGILTTRFRRQEMVVRSVLLASAIGSIASFISDLPEAVGIVCGLVVGAAVITDFVARAGTDRRYSGADPGRMRTHANDTGQLAAPTS